MINDLMTDDMGGPTGETMLDNPMPMGEPVGNSLEQCVPLDALAVPGEGEEMTPPEVGDLVNYTVEGKVTRIEGGKAYVDPETINGTPVQQAEAGTPDPDAAAYSALEDEAREMGGM